MGTAAGIAKDGEGSLGFSIIVTVVFVILMFGGMIYKKKQKNGETQLVIPKRSVSYNFDEGESKLSVLEMLNKNFPASKILFYHPNV